MESFDKCHVCSVVEAFHKNDLFIPTCYSYLLELCKTYEIQKRRRTYSNLIQIFKQISHIYSDIHTYVFTVWPKLIFYQAMHPFNQYQNKVNLILQITPILFKTNTFYDSYFLPTHLVMCHCVRAKQKSNFMRNGVDMDWFKNSNSEHFSLRT